jgi:large subunit ribosomal protein L10
LRQKKLLKAILSALLQIFFMALTKEQKQKIIADLKEEVAKQKVMLFLDFTGLKVKDLFDLRKKLKEEEAKLIVAKKTLAGLAFQELDAKISSKIKELEGQIAVIFGFKDEISPAKIAYQFSQGDKNLKILGGFFENKFQDSEEMISLAKLPAKEELLARTVGSIKAPFSGLVNVLEGNLRNLVCLLSQIKKVN